MAGKRTSLGRFAHEDCRTSRVIAGENLAFYMGDDSRGEYIYKFVSDAKWDPKDINGGYAAGDKYMNAGKLYVAKFNNDGTGQWIELAFGKNGLNQSNSVYPFSSQADVVTFARLAADAVGATKMDQLKENINSVDIQLSKEIIDEINDVHENNPSPAP